MPGRAAGLSLALVWPGPGLGPGSSEHAPVRARGRYRWRIHAFYFNGATIARNTKCYKTFVQVTSPSIYARGSSHKYTVKLLPAYSATTEKAAEAGITRTFF